MHHSTFYPSIIYHSVSFADQGGVIQNRRVLYIYDMINQIMITIDTCTYAVKVILRLDQSFTLRLSILRNRTLLFILNNIFVRKVKYLKRQGQTTTNRLFSECQLTCLPYSEFAYITVTKQTDRKTFLTHLFYKVLHDTNLKCFWKDNHSFKHLFAYVFHSLMFVSKGGKITFSPLIF